MDDETVLTLAVRVTSSLSSILIASLKARFNVDPMHLLSLVQQNKKDFYKLSKVMLFVIKILLGISEHATVEMPDGLSLEEEYFCRSSCINGDKVILHV